MVLKELGTDLPAIDDVFSGPSSDREGRGRSRQVRESNALTEEKDFLGWLLEVQELSGAREEKD